MSILIENNNEFITDFIRADSYSIIEDNYQDCVNKRITIDTLLSGYVCSLSANDKFLLSTYFCDIDCNDSKLVNYINAYVDNNNIRLEIKTYVNEYKKKRGYIILMESMLFPIHIDKKDIDGCNSVDEYLRLRDLKKKINNF